MHNVKLILAYDGTAYLGWQHTPEGSSIELTLRSVLEKVLQHPVHLQAASRTDRGVHALGQTVNFLTSKSSLDLSRLQLSLNSLLPRDIVVLSIDLMPPSFHPTLDCKGKEYRYFICHGREQLPQHRFYSWHYPALLDYTLMQQAAQYLIGSHNFSAFCNFRKQLHYEHYIREIQEIEITGIEENRLCVRIAGNHFLYKMVRNIVGTLVYVGKGEIDVLTIPDILQAGDRTLAGMTAPAHGLFLHGVYY